MPESGLGLLLRDLRSERGLTLRETGQLADVDYSYIQRLESGEREAPSDEILGRLTKVLRPPKREADMLLYLAAHSDADPGLVSFVRADPSISFDVYKGAASASFRGAARPEYSRLIERVRRILEEDDDG